MIQEKVAFNKGDELYHSKHGLCLVRGVTSQRGLGGDDLFYWLEPARPHHANPRFFISVEHLQEAGFHEPISKGEAMKILECLEKGDAPEVVSREDRIEAARSFAKENTPWANAKTLLLYSETAESESSYEDRKILRHAAEGLVQELAFVLRMTFKQAASLIRKNLGYSQNKIWVRKTLEQVGQDGME